MVLLQLHNASFIFIQIIAAAKLGTAPDTDIAVDDIRVNNGLCVRGSQGKVPQWIFIRENFLPEKSQNSSHNDFKGVW